MKLNKYIDHTYLKAMGGKEVIEKLCAEAREYDFKSVCVNPCNVALAKKLLEGSDVLVCTVVGFPLGQNTTATKLFETKEAIENGAREIDMVINVAKLKDQDYDYVKNEIKVLKDACGSLTLKVIIETCYLTKDEIRKVSELALEAGADFVKTSTGFGTRGATFRDIELIREGLEESNTLVKAKIKASGGIRTREEMKKYIEMGCDRIGASVLPE